ncbi:MAG: CCA tRNA nucleotidyltransferase, partial [Candidatus Cloacimonetes bacterium]|nr:CCA tRNA nucleotidyltransferase [Candidatus Cloacimonadota bacterium]
MNLCQLCNLISDLIQDTEFAGRSYFAGGCVRDFILGRDTEDFDICVELPEGGIRLANYLAKKLKTRPPVVYAQFGTAMLKYGRHKLEFVMTRQESYRPYSRNPRVSFGSLEQDIQRRDFTINAMLLNISSGLLVDLGQRGQKDIQEGIIRCVANPDRTFREDPLRILRAIRFAHTLDFEIESATEHSLIT